MEIEAGREQGVLVLALHGRLDAAGAARLAERTSSLPAGERACVLDLAGVDYVSSMGLRSLVALERILGEREGVLVFAGVAAFVERVLKLTGLLEQLRLAASVGEAIEIARSVLRPGAQSESRQVEGRSYAVAALAGRSVLEEWRAGNRLQTLSLDALALAFGSAGLGIDALRARDSVGVFVSSGHVVGVRPAGEPIADFVVADAPAESTIHMASALTIAGDPALMVDGVGEPAIPLARLAGDLEALAEAAQTAPLGLLVIAVAPVGTLVLVAVLSPAGAPPLGDAALRIGSLDSGRALLGAAFQVRGDSGSLAREVAPALASLLRLDALEDVVVPAADSLLALTRAWVFRPDGIRPGADKLVAIESSDGAELREEWKVIARRLHPECSRVLLTPLHGGYMSTTFRVTSTDREGRRQLPRVLKLGPEALTRREEQAHRRYVETFILNNSTTILGTASEGEWAGLLYNFLGISGPDSQLGWLWDAYVARPTEAVLPLLERLYTRILEPWYGQPIETEVALYADHDPSRLFPTLQQDAAALLGIGADDPMLPCPELGRDLPNPFHFLAHEYPRRASTRRRFRTSVTHGDLNLRNVLLDERDNLYVIDFSETRPRSAVADFARLEPIVKFEMPRIESSADLTAMLGFEQALHRTERLDDTPFDYAGDDPEVAKSHAVIALLRRVARQAAGSDAALVPYWLAVLEWTLPVVCFVQVSPLRKRYAAYSAGLICQRILEREP